MYRLWIALSFLLRRPILRIAMVGVMLGLGSLLVVDSILKGVLDELKRTIRGTLADILVLLPADLDYGRVRDELLETPGVAGVAPRLTRPCLLRTDVEIPAGVGLGQLSRGPMLQLFGVLPEQEATVSGWVDFLERPPPEYRVADPRRPFDGSDPGDAVPPMILGYKLAEILGVGPGDEIELLTFSDEVDFEKGIDPLRSRFRLVGTFRTGYYYDDLRKAFVSLPDLQRLARLPTQAHEVAVRAQPGVDLELLREEIRNRLAPLPRRFVETWDQSQEVLLGAIENQRNVLGLILFCIILVAGFNLLVTLNMMVTEKRRDIGILASLGASPGGVAVIFTGCGLLVSVVGLLLGAALGTLVALNINPIHDAITKIVGAPVFREDVYGFREIPVNIDPMRVGVFAVATVICTLIFTSLAAWKAARVEPIESLRGE